MRESTLKSRTCQTARLTSTMTFTRRFTNVNRLQGFPNDVIRLRVAVTRPPGPPHGSLPHDSSTNVSCQIECRHSNTRPLTLIHVIPPTPRRINDFLQLEAIKPEFLKKIKTYDRVNIIYFWKVQVQPESVSHQKQQRRHQSFILVQAQSWIFFSKNRFQINEKCVEPKYTLQITALFLNWKQPFYRLKCIKYSIYV